MKMHSCFDCKFRKLPLKDTSCDKGVVEKGGLVLQCLGWQEEKSKTEGLQKYCQDDYTAALENEEAIDEAIREIRKDRGAI